MPCCYQSPALQDWQIGKAKFKIEPGSQIKPFQCRIYTLSLKHSPGHLLSAVHIPLAPTSLSELCLFVAQATSTRQMIPLEISGINHALKVPFHLLNRGTPVYLDQKSICHMSTVTWHEPQHFFYPFSEICQQTGKNICRDTEDITHSCFTCNSSLRIQTDF